MSRCRMFTTENENRRPANSNANALKQIQIVEAPSIGYQEAAAIEAAVKTAAMKCVIFINIVNSHKSQLRDKMVLSITTFWPHVVLMNLLDLSLSIKD